MCCFICEQLFLVNCKIADFSSIVFVFWSKYFLILQFTPRHRLRSSKMFRCLFYTITLANLQYIFYDCMIVGMMNLMLRMGWVRMSGWSGWREGRMRMVCVSTGLGNLYLRKPMRIDFKLNLYSTSFKAYRVVIYICYYYNTPPLPKRQIS